MTTRLHRGDLPDVSRFGKEVAIDTETMGLDPRSDRLCVVQLSPGDGSADVVQIPADLKDAPNLVSLLTDPNRTKIFHYARFDMAVLKHRFGVVTGPVWCTKIASKLARTYTDRHGLKDLARELINVDMNKQQHTSCCAARDGSNWPKPASASCPPVSSSICWAGTKRTSSRIPDGSGAHPDLR